jgi:hypothetical protein
MVSGADIMILFAFACVLPTAVDDTPYSFTHYLSTRNFAFPSIAQAAINYILDPSNDFFRNRRRIEYDGIIATRGATGPAKG